MKKCFFAICCLLLLVVSSYPLQAGNSEITKILTGPETGTYYAFGNNIAGLMPKKSTLKVIASNGSIDNIRQIVEGKGTIALGVVQSDILGFLKRSTNKNTKKVADHLSMVFPFYDEEVHIFARNTIKGLHDLNGKRIIIGEQGSGNMLTATNILALANIKAGQISHLPPEEGVVAVLSGKADAMFFVGGKPVPLFSNLSALKQAKGGTNAHLLDQVHFIPIDDQRIYTEYSPTRINKEDYPFMRETVLTAKVSAVLIAYNESKKTHKNTKECSQIQQVSELIANHLDALKSTGHPKWKEINLYADIQGWPRNACIWQGKTFFASPKLTAPALKEKDAELSNDLLDIVKHGTSKP